MDIPFQIVSGICRRERLNALAAIPLPGLLDPAGYDRLLADGVGDLGWLSDPDERRRRLDPGRLLPSARSLLVCAWAHQPDPGEEPGGLRRARYAAGKDYHAPLRGALGRVGAALNREASTQGLPPLRPCGPTPGLCQDSPSTAGQLRASADGLRPFYPPTIPRRPTPSGRDGAPPEQLPGTWHHRATVDSAPLNERTLARLAGLGWIGRHGLLVSPERGSWAVLGCLLTEAPISPAPGPHGADRCGTCTRCETACPTGALVGGRVLTERCISYLTIEHRGVIPRALAARLGGWWFGCDLCQEACPWNRFAPPADDARLNGHEDAAVLLTIGPGDFDRHFAGRAVRRLGYARFRRNLLAALWSLGRVGACAPIIAEGLAPVRAQAAELGLAG